MKIALFNCHIRSIPPTKSGGIEKIINYLMQGFTSRGHQVTLFSVGKCEKRKCLEKVSIYPQEIEKLNLEDEVKEEVNCKLTLQLAKELAIRRNEFDIISNHCLGAGLPALDLIKTRIVSTIHETLTKDAIKRITPFKKGNFISISYAQRKPFPDLNYVANIYNAIDVNSYPIPTKPEEYLVFVGRISWQKAPHLAILTAKKLGMKLFILGKYKDKHLESEYYHKYFLPTLLANKKNVEWLDEVDEKTVQKYFNKAIASLHPLAYSESFGLTLIEAMASGCPVIAFNQGSIPEIIENNKTGFIVEDVKEMIKAVSKIGIIDRNYCRSYTEKRFNIPRMIDEYLDIYNKIIT